MLKILYNLSCTIKVRKNVWFQPFQRCSTIAKRTVESNIKTNQFTKHEKEILHVLNASNLKELSKYIAVSYATTIISNRENKHYESLNDFLSKNELNSDVLNQFYTSIVAHRMQKEKFKKSILPDVKTIEGEALKKFHFFNFFDKDMKMHKTPSNNDYFLTLELPTSEMPKTILGVHVGPSAVTWTLLNSNFKVLDWDCLPACKENLKINSFNLINMISSVVASLPQSSSYVIEECRIINKLKLQSISIPQQMTIAIASCLKFLGDDSSESNNVYIMKPLTAARFFNLLVGNEEIAAEYIMKMILNNNVTNIQQLEGISIDSDLKEKYTEKTIEQQEQIGWSLLKVITFLHLIKIFSINIENNQSV